MAAALHGAAFVLAPSLGRLVGEVKAAAWLPHSKAAAATA